MAKVFTTDHLVDALTEKQLDPQDPQRLLYWIIDAMAGSRAGGHVAAQLTDMARNGRLAPELRAILEGLEQ